MFDAFLHMFWNVFSAASWWWWTSYCMYAKGRGWKGIISIPNPSFFLSSFGEGNMEGLTLYPSLSWVSCIFVVTVSKCFFWLSLQLRSEFSRTASTAVQTFVIKTIGSLINKQAWVYLCLLLNNSVLVQLIDQVELKKGPLEQFTHEMELFLRK